MSNAELLNQAMKNTEARRRIDFYITTRDFSAEERIIINEAMRLKVQQEREEILKIIQNMLDEQLEAYPRYKLLELRQLAEGKK
jgi:hypothetical protein